MESHQHDLELDFLDEMIAERTSVDPAFPLIVEAAFQRRQVDAEWVAESAPDPK